MHQTDACQFCEAPATIMFGRRAGSRLTLIYWTCQRCKRNNVSTWDWELHELAACHVMQPGEQQVWKARETLRRKAQQQQQRRHR